MGSTHTETTLSKQKAKLNLVITIIINIKYNSVNISTVISEDRNVFKDIHRLDDTAG